MVTVLMKYPRYSLQKLTPIRGRKLFLAVSEKLSTKLKFTETNPDKGTETNMTD